MNWIPALPTLAAQFVQGTQTNQAAAPSIIAATPPISPAFTAPAAFLVADEVAAAAPDVLAAPDWDALGVTEEA